MKEGDLAIGKKEYNRSMDLYLKAGALIPDLPIPNFKVALAMDKGKNFEKANKY